MTAIMDRRGFLARLGLAAGTATIAAASTTRPAAIEEDPAILELGEKLIPAVADLRTTDARHQEAVDHFHAVRPPLPIELRDRALWARDPDLIHDAIRPAQLTDGFGHDLWEGSQPIRFMSSAALADARSIFDGRTIRARRCKRLLPIVERYEIADAAASAACGVGEARAELERLRTAFLELGTTLFDLDARTMIGIEIKAGAIGAVPLLGKPFEWVAMQWGPKLAENLLVVLAVKDGAA